MRVVIALGGNALLRRGERPDAAPQLQHVTHAADHLSKIAAEHELLIVHGNGPQVGLLALESAADRSLSRPYPLGDLVAETQGLIGYWLQQAIGRSLDGPVVTLVTQTIVEVDDPAFAAPTKFVGSVYDEPEMEALSAQHDWTFAKDGDGWRRVVASPRPQRVVEVDTADALLHHGATVVLAGGGGVPVVLASHGLEGVEAVIDKDLVASLLARQLAADLFLVLTDVPAVMAEFGTPQQRPIGKITPAELAQLQFPAGSMGPKIDAVREFVLATGHRASIGSLDDLAAVFTGTAGTQVLGGL
ncbi:carbamate kinase [Marmoricola sp. URHB0036]|uniref:carbamate kinase n=1 Tax=Marmoricola sp. URHB0036 TaxID=1298863 RepID=UPI00042409E6|nr:carbamate kinase [Marmoricola sp. URHB0036]